jgi:hypothetical protein
VAEYNIVASTPGVVPCISMTTSIIKFLHGKRKWNAHSEETGIEGWITLKLISKKQDGRHAFD